MTQTWESAKNDHIKYLHHEWRGVDLQTFALQDTGQGPQGKSFDLFGDGTVEFIWVPGHSDGLCATRIKNPETGDYILLASDVGYTKANWEENLTPGVVNNREQAQQALDWLAETIQDPHCKEVIANHDTEIKPKIIEI